MSNDLPEYLEIPQTGQGRGRQGMLVVVSSPSGGGKGTLISRVLQSVPGVGYSVSFTTRAPRSGEKEGHDYFFVSQEQFARMVEANAFLEWAVVHGHRYGTAREQVVHELCQGRDIILEIDVQGAASVRRIVGDAIGVFILPPSYDVLRSRLLARGTDSPEELALRLKNGRSEVEQFREFDYVIINDDADAASLHLASVIFAERVRRARQENMACRILETFPLPTHQQ